VYSSNQLITRDTSIATAVGIALPVGAGLAQPIRGCAPGQSPTFQSGFGAVKGVLGDVMGEPVSCEHADPNWQRRHTSRHFGRPGILAQVHKHADIHQRVSALGFHAGRNCQLDAFNNRPARHDATADALAAVASAVLTATADALTTTAIAEVAAFADTRS
jgi:hypothetical protein